MEQTVVGLFDDANDAQDAMAELMEEGFIEENIDLSNRGTATETMTDEDTGDGIGDRIANFFNSLFGDDESTARNYTYAANDAEAILTVHVDSAERAELARDILDRNGAIDVGERSDAYTTGSTGEYGGQIAEGATKIPVVEERLDVGKREVERGGARLRSRIIERPVEESVRLREEHVVVKRRPVDREVTRDDLNRFQPGEMEITERAEVPIIGKQSRVVEEVEVGKQVTERDETVRDTVRSTQVDVEDIETRDGTPTDTKARRAKP
jgi:stress response protein YsnF